MNAEPTTCFICDENTDNANYYIYKCHQCNSNTRYCFSCNRAIDRLLNNNFFKCFRCGTLVKVFAIETRKLSNLNLDLSSLFFNRQGTNSFNNINQGNNFNQSSNLLVNSCIIGQNTNNLNQNNLGNNFNNDSNFLFNNMPQQMKNPFASTNFNTNHSNLNSNSNLINNNINNNWNSNASVGNNFLVSSSNNKNENIVFKNEIEDRELVYRVEKTKKKKDELDNEMLKERQQRGNFEFLDKNKLIKQMMDFKGCYKNESNFNVSTNNTNIFTNNNNFNQNQQFYTSNSSVYRDEDKENIVGPILSHRKDPSK